MNTGTEKKRSISFSSDEEFVGISEGRYVYKSKRGKCTFVHPARPGDVTLVSMKDPEDNNFDTLESSFLSDSSASEEEQ